MTSRIHGLIARIALVMGPVLVGAIVGAYLWFTRPYVVPVNTDIFAVVAGRWAWTTADSGCTRHEWHRITFTPDHKVMTITHAKAYVAPDGTRDSIAVYDIQAYTRSWIRGAIRGETRLTAQGRPVVWDLVLRSPDRYAWHRTDWFRGGYTATIERCVDALPTER